MIQAIDTTTFFKDIYEKQDGDSWKSVIKRPTVVFFHAAWCGVCKKMKPNLEKIAEEYKDHIDVFGVDGDKEEGLMKELDVTFLPTLLLIPMDGDASLKEGEPKDGLLEKYFEVLKDY